jgi:hypothetical protein
VTLFWDRAGHPIEDTLEWAKLYEDAGYRFVALDVEGDDRVSTIWEGVDGSHGRLPAPMIFRTAYFVGDEIVDEFSWPSEDSALIGHSAMCFQLLGRLPRPEDGHLQAAIENHKR